VTSVMTYQERNKHETERLERQLRTANVSIEALTREECGRVAERCWHSCRDEGKGEIGGASLPLAVAAVATICGGATVTVDAAGHFLIRPHRARSREDVFREGYQAGLAWLRVWIGWALQGPIPWDAKTPAEAERAAWQLSAAYSADLHDGIQHVQHGHERTEP
jgi:hypothetical protein